MMEKPSSATELTGLRLIPLVIISSATSSPLTGQQTCRLERSIVLELFAPTGGCHTKICNKKSAGIGEEIVLKPGTTPGINTFSLSINTTDWQSNWYIFLFTVVSSDNPAEVDAFNQLSEVDSSVQLYSEDLRSTTEHSLTTHPDAGISYWMSVSNMVEYTRPCYQLSGTTSLPPTETISYSFLDGNGSIQGLYHGGIVVPGEKPGINRFIIPVNTSHLTEWIYIIVWNPRYNSSDRSDSPSISTNFLPSPNLQNVSTNCSVTVPVTTPSSPLSVIGTCGALLVFLCICLLTKKWYSTG